MVWKVVATMQSAKQEPNKIPFANNKNQMQSCFKKIGHNEIMNSKDSLYLNDCFVSFSHPSLQW